MTAPLDMDALEAAAWAATPGPWGVCGSARGGCSCGQVWSTSADMLVATAERGDDEVGQIPEAVYKANAAYIAAANPAVVLELVARLRVAEAPPVADDVEWIVNDMGELGVRVRGRCYFCYKGESLVYEHGIHDGGEPILHRNVGKREFGETVWPYKWNLAGVREDRYTQELKYTPGLSFGPPDNPKYKWLPLPVEVPNAHS